jgi:hypothetical protein
VCITLTTCSSDEYQSAAPTTYSDRVCITLTTCSSDEYQSTAPTTTSNRICSALTTCSSDEYQNGILTGTSDRICSTLTTCSSDEYQNGILTGTSDRICSTLTTCTDIQYQFTAPTSTSNRVCNLISDNCEEYEIQIPSTATTDRQCLYNDNCIRRSCIIDGDQTIYEDYSEIDTTGWTLHPINDSVDGYNYQFDFPINTFSTGTMQQYKSIYFLKGGANTNNYVSLNPEGTMWVYNIQIAYISTNIQFYTKRNTNPITYELYISTDNVKVIVKIPCLTIQIYETTPTNVGFFGNDPTYNSQSGKWLIYRTKEADVGLNICGECNSTAYYDTISKTCKTCPLGKIYNNNQCESCAAGYIASNITHCLMCPSGKYAPFNIGCYDCPYGTTQPNDGRCSCVVCDPGRYIPYGYSLNCIVQECLPGFADVDNTAASPCTECAYASFSGSVTCEVPKKNTPITTVAVSSSAASDFNIYSSMLFCLIGFVTLFI